MNALKHLEGVYKVAPLVRCSVISNGGHCMATYNFPLAVVLT